MYLVFKDELIQYTSQIIAKSINEYYFNLKYHFHNLPDNELINQICEYTELTFNNINDREYIINIVLPKILEEIEEY